MKLKPYMVYSRSTGKEDGAVLVFAERAKQARIIGWKESYLPELAYSYIDIVANYLKGDWFRIQGNPLKMADGIPHVIESPHSCKRCKLWGREILQPEGLCIDCLDEQKDIENGIIA